MKRWRAPRDLSTVLYLLGALLCGGGAAAALLRLRRDLRGPLESWPITLLSFGLALGIVVGIVGCAALLWSAARSASLRYELDRNAITAVRLGSRYTIPLQQIVAVSADVTRQRPQRPIQRIGRGRPAQLLEITTVEHSYRLAIVERDSFARELQERRQLGAVRPQPEGLIHSWPALYAFWSAPSIQRLLLLTLLLNLGLWAMLAWRYPVLPDTIPVRFDPVGGTAGTRPRTYTLLLPGVATAMALINSALAVIIDRRSRLAGELLLLGALVLQAILLVAVSFISTVAG